jgi:hypothetical protein
MNPTKPEPVYDQRYEDWFHDALAKGIVSAASDGDMRQAWRAAQAPRVWRCSCGSPSLPGVLHRADRPCYAVRDEGGAE